MIEVAYHPVPAEVNQHLESIANEPTRQRVAQGIQRIHLIESWGDVHSTGKDSDHKFAHENETVSRHMTAIASDVSHVYANQPGDSRIEIEPESVWSPVLSLQLNQAREANGRGDHDTVRERLIDYVITTELSLPSTLGYREDDWFMEQRRQIAESILDRVVSAGLAEQLVDAARNSYGLVYLEPDSAQPQPKELPISIGRVVSIAHTIEDIAPQIEAVVGRIISVDPDEPTFGEDLDEQSVTDRINSMHMDGSVAVAGGVALNNSLGLDKKSRILDTASHRALAAAAEDAGYDSDRGDLLIRLAEANPLICSSPEYNRDFQLLRNVRRVNSQYRINNLASTLLDIALVYTWEYGQPDLAKRMLTLGFEIGDQDLINIGALDPFLRGKHEFRQEIMADIQARRANLNQNLQDALNEAGEDHIQVNKGDKIDTITTYVTASSDPETAGAIVSAWAEKTDLDDIITILRLIGARNIPDRRSELLDSVIGFYSSEAGEQLTDILVGHPFVSFLKPSGILRPVAGGMIHRVLAAEDMKAFCDNMYSTFTRPEPLWKSLVRFNELLVGIDIDTVVNGPDYAVRFYAVPKLKPGADPHSFSFDDILGYEAIPIDGLSIQDKRIIVGDGLANLADSDVEALGSINFNLLTGQLKRESDTTGMPVAW